MAFRVGQQNFSKGELSEDLLGRIDVSAYSTGLKRARNVIILKYGGVTKRPGTRFVAEVFKDQGVRLVPFQFSLTQTYALELGQAYMRVLAGGAKVIEEKLTITDIIKGATTTIEAAYHAYEEGDEVYFEGIEGMTELNGRTLAVLAGGTADTFIVDIDSTGFGDFTADTGGLPTRVGPPPPPPPPPPVPPPAPPPPPPDTGGGGGGGGYPGGGYCVSDDTLILLADGREIEARFLKVGFLLRTRHAGTMEWGVYPVEAIDQAWRPVFAATIGDVTIRATAEHRFLVDGRWVRADSIGEPSGYAWVSRITVAEAHTYVTAGVLSHNKIVDPIYDGGGLP